MQIDRETMETVTNFIWGAPKSLQMVTAAMKSKDACSLEEMVWPPKHIKRQRDYFANNGPSSQSYVFSSSQVLMWELDHKESCALKKHKCLNCGVGEDSWKSCGQQGDWSSQSWIFIGILILEYSLILKLKLQYFGHLMGRADWKRPWCWERLKEGREGDNRGWDGWMASRWTWVWANSES